MSTFPVNGYNTLPTTTTPPAGPTPIVVDVGAQQPSTSLPGLDLTRYQDAFKGMTPMSGVRMGASAYGVSKAAAWSAAARGGARIGTKSAASRAVANGFFKGGMARAIGASALVAIPMSLITNFIDFKRGKITESQRNTLMVADAAGYTAAGAGGTMIGAAIGSLIMPGVGTVVGVAAGIGLGYLYEKYLRPRWNAAPNPGGFPIDAPK